MKAGDVRRAVAAGMSTVSAQGLRVEDSVVLHNSNRLAVRLLPCDVLVRVAPESHHEGAMFELEVARRLADTDSPIAGLEPRVAPQVYLRDGFVITVWTYFEAVASRELTPPAYAEALTRLHGGLRQIELPAPHFTDRVGDAQRLVGSRALTPQLGDTDRRVLDNAFRSLTRMIVDRGAPEQLLHGEPHPGNVLSTGRGPLFIDLETCCRGPVEFDLAHCSQPDTGQHGGAVDFVLSEDVVAQYPSADRELVRTCWVLVLAMVAAWRWDRDDEFPNREREREAVLTAFRAGLDRYGLIREE